jgi:hypothetical protein
LEVPGRTTITLRFAGRPVEAICAAVGRSEVWLRKWWGRYLEAGPEGLYDLTRANHYVAVSFQRPLVFCTFLKDRNMLVDPIHQRLAGCPEHRGKHMIDLY